MKAFFPFLLWVVVAAEACGSPAGRRAGAVPDVDLVQLADALGSGRAAELREVAELRLVQRAAVLRSAPARVVCDELIVPACYADLLRRFAATRVRPEVWRWLFSSEERLRTLSSLLEEEDHPVAVAALLEQLYDHDPTDRDRFFNLMLALAVVWDSPRKPMHSQTGGGWLKPDHDVTLYYDYFKELYRSGRSKVPYSELSAGALAFVVDVPAPVSELRWAAEQVAGVRANWGAKYEEVRYDSARMKRGEYAWPAPVYSLSEIRLRRGLCVDQAWFAVLSARAHGIPALYFRGIGSAGGHAWFGYLKGPGQWDLAAGREPERGCTIGFAVHPQTGRDVSDRQLAATCLWAREASVAREALLLARLSGWLAARGEAASAQHCAQAALQLDPHCIPAWDVQYATLLKAGRTASAAEWLDRQAQSFAEDLDLMVNISLRQAELLSRRGDLSAAERLLAKADRSLPDERDDLRRTLVTARSRLMAQRGDSQGALKLLEKTLRQQRADGAKLFQMLEEYLTLARTAGRLPAAREFLCWLRSDLQEVLTCEDMEQLDRMAAGR